MAALARARGWLYDIFAHNFAEALKTRRAVERKALGVETVQDLPYPGASINTTTTTTAPATATPGSGNQLKTVVASALGGLGLGGALLLGNAALQKPVVTSQPSSPPASVAPANPGATSPGVNTTTPATELIPWVSYDGGKTWKQMPVGK